LWLVTDVAAVAAGFAVAVAAGARVAIVCSWLVMVGSGRGTGGGPASAATLVALSFTAFSPDVAAVAGETDGAGVARLVVTTLNASLVALWLPASIIFRL